MVRFIIYDIVDIGTLWDCNLHSNMVRFIIHYNQELPRYIAAFTFQYG